jgi:Protein of unknown function (DUF2735)
MSEDTQRKSAKIYQFPAGGRAALSGAREMTKPASDVKAPPAVRVVFGSSWYHEAAVQEAEQSRKR